MLRAALIYAVLAVLLVSPALPPGRTLSASDGRWRDPVWHSLRPDAVASNPDLGDSYFQSQLFLQHTRATLPHIPLWNPYLMGGRPFLANAQSAVFSPFSTPAYVLPFWRSLAVIAALKLCVAALGAYLLGCALGMRFAGALLAGIVFAFSFWFVTWVSWPTASVWALLPWLWLCAERIARRADTLAICALAVVVAVQFLGGHPESSFYALISTWLFFLLRLQRGPPWTRLAALAGGMALGAALAGLMLAPLLEFLEHSGDRANRRHYSELHIPARYLLGLFLHDYWGRPTRGTTDLFGPAMQNRAWYVGAPTLMLAAAALMLRRDALRLALAVACVVTLAIAVGTPPFPDVLGALPGFDVSDNSRLAVLFVLCAALLAGLGLDELIAARGVQRTRLLTGIGAAILVTPLVWMFAAGQRPWASVAWDSFRSAWLFDFPDRHVTSIVALEHLVATIRTAALFEWLLPAAAALLLLWLRATRRLGAEPFAALAIALVVVDLFKADIGINPSIATDDAIQPATPAIRQLQRNLPNRFAGLGGDPLHVNLGMRYGLLDARGYDFPIDERYYKLWTGAVARPGCGYTFCTSGADSAPRALHALGLLSVSRVLEAPDRPRLAKLRMTYSGPDGRIYANPDAAPRAFVVGRERLVASPDAALAAVTDESFDPTEAAVTEERISGLAGGSGGPARIVEYRDEYVTVEADTPEPGLLVLTDVYAPGWKATIDGASVPIHRVDYLLRGVRIPGGRHRVEFSYEPASWRIGLAFTAAGLLALVLLTARGVAQRVISR